MYEANTTKTKRRHQNFREIPYLYNVKIEGGGVGEIPYLYNVKIEGGGVGD